MTATIHVPAYGIAQSVPRDADALRFAKALRDEYPTLEVVVEFFDTPARDESGVKTAAGEPATRPSRDQEPVTGGDVDLEIPGFLRRPFKT